MLRHLPLARIAYAAAAAALVLLAATNRVTCVGSYAFVVRSAQRYGIWEVNRVDLPARRLVRGRGGGRGAAERRRSLPPQRRRRCRQDVRTERQRRRARLLANRLHPAFRVRAASLHHRNRQVRQTTGPRGGSTGGARGRSHPPPAILRRLLVKQIETPGRLKVGFIRSRMHHNSPFELKNRNIFWGGSTAPTHTPRPVERGTHPPHTPHLGASVLGARLDSRSALDLGLRRLHSPPSHTFWIRP